MDWSKVTIRQFVELKDLKLENDLETKITILSIITGKPEDYFYDMELSKLREYASGVSFINKVPSEKIKYTFKIKGIKFVANTDIRSYKGSDYIDLMNYCKDGSKINDNLHNILSVICKPYKWFREVKMSKKEKADLFYEHLTIDIAYPIAVFFYRVWNSLIAHIQTSLEKERKQIQKKIWKMSLKSKRQKHLKTDGNGL